MITIVITTRSNKINYFPFFREIFWFKIKIFTLLLIPVFAVIVPVFAFDISELGDYNSRSMYLNSQKKQLNQEKIDLLKAKKLTPDVQCLNKQIKKNNFETPKHFS